MKRTLWVDNFRGLAMIIMCFDHFAMTTPPLTWLLNYTWETFGFVGMAEVFVFLSGFCVGRSNSQAAKLRRRAGYLYFVHLAMVVFIAVLAWIKPSLIPQRMGPSHYHPSLDLLMGAVFLFQPFLADIIPLYIGFLLVAPFVLRRLRGTGKYRFFHVLFPSVGLWVLAQIMPQYSRVIGPAILPFFNPLGWQLLFVLGIIAGYFASTPSLMEKIESGIGFHRRKLVISLVALALGCFVLHGQYFGEMPYFSHQLADRRNLGPLRIINFYALMGLGWAAYPWATKFRSPKLLSLVSANSLLVYSTSTYMIYLWMVVQTDKPLHWSIWTQAAVVFGMFFILFSLVRLVQVVGARRAT